MPEARKFLVTQTREVEVDANNAVAALLFAESAFDHGQNSDNGVLPAYAPVRTWGNTTSRVREVSLHAEEKRN